MYVVKRDGRQEAVHFDKITARLKKLSYGLNTEYCDAVLVAQKVCAGVYKGVTTTQLDELAAQTAAALTANHLDYALLSSCFLLCMKDDSIEGIYNTLKECAVISKSAGGIGVSVYNIGATSSYVRGTNGTSNGIVPKL